MKGGQRSDARSSEGIFEDKDAIEQIFPKTTVPVFTTLQRDFINKFQSERPGFKRQDSFRRSRKADAYMQELRRAYNLCLANMALTRRLLDTEAESHVCWQEGQSVQDLVLPDMTAKQREPHKSPPPDSEKEPTNVRPPSCGPLSDTSSRCSLDVFFHSTPEPLSIEDVCRQSNVKVIDCGTQLWSNYTLDD
ncbi:uncharacterized protein ACB058_011027 [Synchiropus picturatus]